MFLKCAAVLYYKAEKAKKDVDGVVHMFNKRRAEAMLGTFITYGIENDHEFLAAAVDSFTKALTSIECTFLPEVWLGKATAQEYNGNIEAAIKTVAAVVRKFPKYEKADEVSMKAAALHMAQEEYGKASSYIRHANLSGRGSMFLSHMDLILISGRMNELWYFKLREEFPEDEDDGESSDSDFYDGESNEEEEKTEDELEEEHEKRERKKTMPEKQEAAEKAYRLVYRHFVEHKNVFGKRSYESWIHHPATWVKVASRASMSGLYLLAEDFYMEALHRCRWWEKWEKRSELEDIEDLDFSSEGDVQNDKVVNSEGESVKSGSVGVSGDGDGEQEEEEDDEEEHPYFHNLKESAVRILFEIAKCKWYHGNVEDAKDFLDKAKDEELYTNTKGAHPFITTANMAWNPKNLGKLKRESKLAFPTLIDSIPQL